MFAETVNVHTFPSPKGQSVPFCKWVFFFKIYIYFQREGKGGREGEKYQCVVSSHVSPTEDLARNLGMCPGWESNQQPPGLKVGAQSAEPHQPGL